MPYPYEPYDPMLAGVMQPAATPFQAYDPSVYNQQQNTQQPYSGIYGGMYGPSPVSQVQPSGQQVQAPVQPEIDLTASTAGMNPNMTVGQEQPMSAPSGYAYDGGNQNQIQGQQQISPEQLAQLRSLLQAGPVEQRFLNANAEVPADVHGLKARLAALGKGLLMGGIGGMGLSVFDPSMVNRAWHRAQLPGMAQAAGYEQAGKQGLLERSKAIESLTGFDPNTGMRGPSAANRDYMNALALGRNNISRDRADAYIGSTQQRASATQKTALIRGFNAELAWMKTGSIVPTLEQTNQLAAKYGLILPPGFDPTKYQLRVDEAGNEQLVPISGANAGQSQPVTAGGAPVESFEATKERGRVVGRAQSAAAQAESARQGRERLEQGERRLTELENKAADEQAEKEIPPVPSARRAPPEVLEERARKVRERADQIKAEKRQQRASSGQSTGSAPQYPPLTSVNIKKGGTFTYTGDNKRLAEFKNKHVRVTEYDPSTKRMRLELVP